MRSVPIQILRVSKHNHLAPLPLPSYQTVGAAGMDLRADLEHPVLLEPGQRKLIPTGFAVAIPEGYEAQIRPRSGLALKHGISMPNTPGTIDSDYRGEVGVILVNLGQESFSIGRGDRIAQMVIVPVIRADVIEVGTLSETQRASGGFGSTGK